MGAEVLTVRTSARRLWELVHRPIGHALAELDGGPHEFRLGAARPWPRDGTTGTASTSTSSSTGPSR